jgi:diguanylate cyclase (GGDEF)-like protein
VAGAATHAPPLDSRNAFTGRRDALFRSYVGTVGLVGLVLLTLAVNSLDLSDVLDLRPAFWALCALLLVAEVRPLFTAGARDANGLVLSTTFVFALLLRFGLPIAVVLQALSTIVADVSRRKAPWRTCFNVSQYTISWSAAAVVMELVGHQASLASPLDLTGIDLVAAGLGGITYFVVNQLLVTVALSLKTGQPVWQLIREYLAYESTSNGALLALSPLVALLVERGTPFLPLLLPPLAAVYRVASIAIEREAQAQTDALTGLPNRTVLSARTADSLLTSGEESTSLLLLDLDRFKQVNDTLGHHVGDRFLQVIARRLAAAVRPGDTVVRLGGDEFALLLPGTSAAGAEDSARRLLETVCAPIVLEGLQVDVDASIGIAVAPEHGTDLDALLQHADVAMYLAKEMGTGVELYDSSRDHNTTSRLVMLGELRRALAEGELEVHYQPQAELRSGRVTGIEALVRWRHPERGLVPPDEFVPLAESSGLIEPLTRHVVDSAVAQLGLWREMGLELRLAVNVSVRDLSSNALVDSVVTALDRYDVPPRCLVLEVTEGSLFAESHRAAATLRRLDELGVALALDDFGTGWSSLGHLRRLPVQELKVDRTFVFRMRSDVRDAAIVRSVVDLGVGLGMRVVAEGVEDDATWDLLLEMGCDEAQGWLLARAEPAAVLTPWLLDRQARLSAKATLQR